MVKKRFFPSVIELRLDSGILGKNSCSVGNALVIQLLCKLLVLNGKHLHTQKGGIDCTVDGNRCHWYCYRKDNVDLNVLVDQSGGSELRAFEIILTSKE